MTKTLAALSVLLLMGCQRPYPVRPLYLGHNPTLCTPFISFSLRKPNPLGDQAFRQEKNGELNIGEPVVGQKTEYLYADMFDAMAGRPEGPSAVDHHPKMQPDR